MRDGPRRSGRSCDDQRTANTGVQLRGPRLRAIADLVSCNALLDGAFSTYCSFGIVRMTDVWAATMFFMC